MSRLEEKRNACRIVVRNPLSKCSPERPRKRSEGNNSVGLSVIGFHYRMSLNLDQGLVSWPALRLADVELLNAASSSFTAFLMRVYVIKHWRFPKTTGSEGSLEWQRNLRIKEQPLISLVHLAMVNGDVGVNIQELLVTRRSLCLHTHTHTHTHITAFYCFFSRNVNFNRLVTVPLWLLYK